jgi:uncharacterized protein YecE (DUF72 family)
MEIHVGCSGWNYSEWRDNFYEGATQKKFFEVYSQTFDTVEINNTFYKFPTESVIQKWEKESPENFIFSIKAPRLITHTKNRFSEELVSKFYSVISLLKNKLGCILFQFPPSFKYDKKILDHIVENLNYDYRNVIEFRHSSWEIDSVFNLFKEKGIIFCNLSSPIENQRPPYVIHHTAEDMFIRFHGVAHWYNHNYSEEELKKWADKVKEFGPKRVWAYFNNTSRGDAVYNAIRFRELLEEKEKN